MKNKTLEISTLMCAFVFIAVNVACSPQSTNNPARARAAAQAPEAPAKRSSAEEFLTNLEGLWKSEKTGSVVQFRFKNGILTGFIKGGQEQVLSAFFSGGEVKALVTLKSNGDLDVQNNILPVHYSVTQYIVCKLDVTDTSMFAGMETLNAPPGTYADNYIKDSADFIRQASTEVDMSECLPRTAESNLSLKNASLTPDRQFLPQLVADDGSIERYSFIRVLNDTERQAFDQRVASFNQQAQEMEAAVKKTEADRKVFLQNLAQKMDGRIPKVTRTQMIGTLIDSKTVFGQGTTCTYRSPEGREYKATLYATNICPQTKGWEQIDPVSATTAKAGPTPGTPVRLATESGATLPPAQATSISPSFDCTKAASVVERLICTTPELAVADNQMAEEYKHAYAAAGPNAAAIKQGQLDFLLKRNRCGTVLCVADAYRARRTALTQSGT